MTGRRMGMAFHESFPLNRTAIVKVLNVGMEFGESVSSAVLRERTNLGPNYVKAMPRYARACGLLNFESFAFTNFGQIAQVNDPDLMQAATHWLMHYYLSTPQGPGPLFWHHLITETLRLGNDIDSARVAIDIAHILSDQNETIPAERTLRSAATVFLGSYSKSEGLSALDLLAPIKGGGFRVQATALPPPMAVAVALADYWAGPLGGRATVDLDELMRPGGFLSLFFLGTEQANTILQALQRARIVEVNRLAPPFQVVRLWDDPASVVARLYEEGHSE